MPPERAGIIVPGLFGNLSIWPEYGYAGIWLCLRQHGPRASREPFYLSSLSSRASSRRSCSASLEMDERALLSCMEWAHGFEIPGWRFATAAYRRDRETCGHVSSDKPRRRTVRWCLTLPFYRVNWPERSLSGAALSNCPSTRAPTRSTSLSPKNPTASQRQSLGNHSSAETS